MISLRRSHCCWQGANGQDMMLRGVEGVAVELDVTAVPEIDRLSGKWSSGAMDEEEEERRVRRKRRRRGSRITNVVVGKAKGAKRFLSVGMGQGPDGSAQKYLGLKN